MSDRRNYLEDEAEEEEEKFVDSSDEDEDEEDKYEEDDGFIVDDVDDDDDAGLDADAKDADIKPRKKKKKKRRYREDSPELAEGDLQLLEEGGVRLNRRPKLKRLKKGASDEEDNARFDDDDINDYDEEEDRFNERRRRADEPVNYDDDMDDFIDDGGRSRRRRFAKEGRVSSQAVQQARNIFGDAEDVAEYTGASKLFKAGQDDDEADPDFQEGLDDADSQLPKRTIRDRDTDYDDEEDGHAPSSRSREEQDENIANELGPGAPSEEAESIVRTDIPERLQRHYGQNPEELRAEALQERAEWIYEKGFKENPDYADVSRFAPEEVTKKIAMLLSYLYIDKFDIPFIAMYRKDYLTPELINPVGEVYRDVPERNPDVFEGLAMPKPRGFNSYSFDGYNPAISIEHARGVPPGYDDGLGDWSTLWLILDLDRQYIDMMQRKVQLRKLIKQCEDNDVRADAMEGLKELVETWFDDQTLVDAEKSIRLSIDLSEAMREYNNKSRNLAPDVEESKLKRAHRRKNQYFDFVRKGYREMSTYLGLTAKQIGANLKGAFEYGQQMQVHVPVECDSDPNILGSLFGRRLNKKGVGEAPYSEPSEEGDAIAEKVLFAARFVLASEILTEVTICSIARRILRKPGTVSITTTPTSEGIAVVDDMHPLRPVTSLSEKKVETFRHTSDFAVIQRAVELGYTKMQVDFQPEQVSLLEKLLNESLHIEKTEGSNIGAVAKWNQQRRMLITYVTNKFVDMMKSEVIDDLKRRTNATLKHKLCTSASRRLMLGPGQAIPQEDGCAKVLAICVTGEDDEESDPLQVVKDRQDAKERGTGSSDRRVARERLTMVALDENGEYVDGYELFAGWLRRPMSRHNPASRLPGGVKEQLKSIILRSKAQMVVIGMGSGGRRVVRLMDDIKDLIRESATEQRTEPDDRPLLINNSETPQIVEAVNIMRAHHVSHEDRARAHALEQEVFRKYLVLVDEFPARIYAKTAIANVGLTFDGMTLLEKRAIALARLAQEPLWVYCGIGVEREYAARLQFHPHHYLARRDDALVALERALCRSVCTVGVDINRALRLPHMKPMLSYVSGLGVHKSKALIDALENVLGEEERGLMSRKHLWTENYLGNTVFLSTAAYLRVRDPEIHPGGSTRRAAELRKMKLTRRSRGRRRDDDHEIYDPIDDSRIHPEHYAIAIKIADEALRDDSGNISVQLGSSEDMTESMKLTSAVILKPQGLSRLALDEYAEHLERNGRGSLFETVKMIASEFQGPFRDYRVPLETPPDSGAFFYITRADPMHVRIGAQVMATECFIRRKRADRGGGIVGISCQLPNDIRGFIPRIDFADDTTVKDQDMEDLVRDGSTLKCRIMHLNFDRFEVTLSSKSSVLGNPQSIRGYVPLVDPSDEAYRPYPSRGNSQTGPSVLGSSRVHDPSRMRLDRINEAMSRLRSTAKAVVQHPFFRDITGEETIQELENGLPGDIIIRPSPYKRDTIVFSCKFAAELPGDQGLNNSAGIFHVNCHIDYDPDDEKSLLRLRIGEKVYEDVEQVLEQYLRPIISNMSESIDHRKFKTGSVTSLSSFVSSQKKQFPKNIPYVIGLSDRRPMTLVLVYIPGNTTVQREEINVVPDGYTLRSVLHKNMDVLVAWFKKNMRKDQPTTRPSTVLRSVMPASPFIPKSPYASVARSPFLEPPKSPFVAPASPFAQATRRSFLAKPASPFIERATATPARDVPPPPVPASSMSRSQVSDPYSQNGPARRPRAQEQAVTDSDWAKATLRDDEPPPMAQNGDYNRRPPARNMQEQSWEQRRQPARPSYDRPMYDHPMNPRPMNPPPMNDRPMRDRPVHDRPVHDRPMHDRPMHDRPMHDRPPRDRQQMPNRRGPQSDSRGGYGGRDENGRRNEENRNNGNGEMPNWRGSRPVPAWKKKAEEAQAQAQNGN